MKVCTKCKVEKESSEFNKRTDIKNGLKSHCKDCMKEYVKRYRKNNMEKVAEYRKKNKEKLAKQQRKWREDNRERVVERGRKWREKNRESIAEKNRKYRENNRDKLAKQKAEYYQDNRERITKQKTEYYHANREKIMEYRKNNPFTTQSSILSSRARTRAREKNIPVDLDFISRLNIANWLKRQPRCECCNVEFDIGIKGQSGPKSSSPSLDRFDLEKGYVKGNVYLICFECNTLKRDVDSKRLRIVVDWMEKIETENELIKLVIDNN